MIRAVCLLLAICSLADAQSDDPWLRIQSANFELFTTAGERNGRGLIRHLERIRSFFEQAFQVRGTAALPAQVIAFGSEKEFAQYRPHQSTAAFFQSGHAHDFIVMQSAPGAQYQVAAHEYIHLLVRQSKLRLPVWLNEGLAELYSTIEPRGSQVLVGKLPRGRGPILLTERWIPLRALLAVRQDSPLYNEGTRAGMFYAESWALLHMLHMSPEYAGKLSMLIEALKHHDAVTAFEKTCGSIEQVDGHLRAYIRRGTLTARLFDIKMQAASVPKVTPNASLPARLALAEMQASRTDSHEKGRAAFDKLAREFPDRWEAEAGLAQFFASKRDYVEAVKHFARAAELGSAEAGMYLQYGRALIAGNRATDSVPVFRKAAALDPASEEARVDLAVAHARSGQFSDAVEAFQKVKIVTPDLAARYFYHFAYACYRLGAVAEAKQLVAKGRTHLREPADIAALDRLTQMLDATER